jgi:carboxylesterase
VIALFGGLIVAGAALAATWFTRRTIRARYESDESPRDYPIEGAEPVSLDNGARGVLILHGFGDTPQSVRALATDLHTNGWTVRAPLLRGHGSTLSAFTTARAEDWLSDARTALDELRSRTTHVAVIGQSMGGALAIILASELRFDVMVLLTPFVRLSRKGARIAAFHRVISLVVPYLRSRSDSSILDPDARRRALGRGVMTPRLAHELSVIVDQAWRAAPQIQSPTLVINSRQDPRITVPDAESAFARLGSGEKTLKWATKSGHVLSVDFDRDWVASEIRNWLESHVARV